MCVCVSLFVCWYVPVVYELLQVNVNTDLKGLPQALKSAENFVFIWAVDFV